MAIATINPTTGETLKVFKPLEDGEIAAKVELAQQSFQEYRQTSFEERSQWLLQAANILEQEKADFAKIMTLEMGKTLKSAIAEVEKCALVCRYYAENAASFLADVTVKTDASHSFIKYQPLGVILAVMPWNFPFWQVFRFAAPALMAGNVGLLKHASNVPQCALAIEDIFHRAGFPKGVFQTLLIGATKVADLMADDRIKAATLTGSEPAGASLAVASGKQIKKTVLELGGSDPFIVLESADLELAVATAVTARMINNGQSCIAAKRFIIADQIADEFEKMLLAKFQTLKIGDPLADDTDIGPLATPDILQDLENQVKIAVENGAKVLTGGNALKDQPGNFYPPTIIIDIPVENPIAKEEFFGPVALLFRVRDINEAIKLANDIPFGLGASAWTNNEAEKNRLIQEIEAGAVFINGMVKSDPRLPFGGIKRSGYGRELSIQGIHEFVNIKTVWMR
ncbi:aldehyde Dehydrogenase [Sphaerospermopsis reniformis]|uniref:Aldehyde Dehydrogenase n=1 Tax=Sphaerospermopsis reniformis TaxID=531300 RepID=A0A480A619_9CYAN|nr:NAD-dependent succinate-semialdehyde dehydrogenase [Sphaerospermopsis reniformis]GCL38778.1 aldehyde Dehydrogenase [Sphaerospermopsis reniformis]